MKVVIIGDGIAGQTVAQNLRKSNNDMEIVMISREIHPYYSRIFLPNYIAGERTKEQLYVRDLDWYDQNNISLLLGQEIEKIDTNEHVVITNGSEGGIKYDKLVLAVGSTPRKIPFGNPDAKGVFTLRTISDADEISEYIKTENVRDVFIIGGGLLGIELAHNLNKIGLKITICEIFPYLLPRQLDPKTSELLKMYLQNLGLNFILGESVKMIHGKDSVEWIEMESGTKFPAQIVMQQLGIIPNIEIGKKSGLEVEKGIIVNEFMQTSDPDVYAVGDCIQFNKQIWGIIPASMEQATQAAAHILGTNPEPYIPSIWHTKLKVAGLDLTCVGSPTPSDEKDVQVMENVDMDKFLCRKVLIEENKLTGAILMGPGGDSQYFIKNIGKKADKNEIEAKIYE